MHSQKEQSLSEGEMETKLCVSHKCLWKCIELVGDIQQSIKYLSEEIKCRKLLNYLIRFFEVWQKFCQTFFPNYGLQSNINRFTDDTVQELNKVCTYLLEILKIVKVCVHVLLRNNVKANDIIKAISFKAIAKFQRYIVEIDFYNKEMFRKSALNCQ